MKVLVADIGGTNSRFAVFEVGPNNELAFVKDVWLETNKFGSLDHILERIVEDEFSPSLETFDVAVVAVPGPVIGNSTIELVHVDWNIDPASIKKKYHPCSVYFINDYVAQAYGCLTEAVRNAILIKEGGSKYCGDIAIIGAGTGLGHGALKSDGRGGYIPIQSEAGHVSFPFVNKDEFSFRDYLARKTGEQYISYDMVVSGPGITLLHEYFTGSVLAPKDVIKTITPNAKTAIWFARFYGRSCRNFCLSIMSLPGMLYITAGIAANNPFLIDNDIFREEFLAAPSMRSLLKDIPIFLNIDENNGLWGAAFYADLLREKRRREMA